MRSINFLLTYLLTIISYRLLNKSSAVAEMGDRLATTWAEKRGRCYTPIGVIGSHLTQCGLGRGLPPYQLAS